jgi:sugar-phosphatase
MTGGRSETPLRALPAGALLFDCDGVLVDSDLSVHRAWTRWAQSYRLDPDAVFAVVHGRRAADTVAVLIQSDLQAEAIRRINRYELEDAASVGAIRGAKKLTISLPPEIWAVVTSGTTALATARLMHAGITRPAILVTADDVAAGKPAPDGYLRAAAGLGVGAVVGVGERVLDAGADVVVADLTGLAWSGGILSIEASALLR